ncbi:flagellar filament capping protein FliD [Paenibacillus sp. 453mf]|uniref:flagellar filament capping protein FliD n=1 Tax=Paenibacillus sp. 453mf TaxID=1761874 RepID=UPI0008EC0FD4|nr:flagellar filament capping protein FliD [Paenibacillus sp. 453mf]SFS85252.1 flagellar hook-associated protein 2 [Paenibacillus sp. 453mf]
MRISGLASGMDTDTIVKQMMSIARLPLDKVNQNKQVLEWQRESYREINSKIVDFRNNKLSSWRMSQTFNSQKATVSGDTAALKASATSSANGVSMSVRVEQLATKTGMEGTLTSSSGRVTNTTTLGSLTGSGSDKYDLKINDKTFSFSKNDSIATVVSKINSSGEATAIFDEVTGKLSITAKDYGVKTEDFEVSGTFANLIGSTGVTEGQQAIVHINGTEMNFDSNSINVNGVQMNLTAVSKTGETTDIVIEQDSTNVVETVKSFVEQYNELLSLLNNKTNEEKYRNFPPLTDAQKEEMSEDEIEKWTEKAQSGLLKNDDMLRSAVSSMRNVITSYLGSSPGGISLADIGITTGSYTENGKLYLNEDKLKKAVESNPTGVMELFQGSATDNSVDGLFDELYTTMGNTLDRIAEKAGTNKLSTDVTAAFNTTGAMHRQLQNYERQITSLTNKMTTLEERYYAQFTAMEKAISQLNTQTNSLAQLFNTGSQ